MKNRRITLRVSDADWQKLHDKATAARMTLTDYLTACGLQKEIVIIDGLDAVIRQQKGIDTRALREREGIKCFIRYAVKNPNVYNIIWGSLAVERQMFEDYYVSFAESYARALRTDKQELSTADVTSLAYMLMGITNFLGLRAIFEDMSDDQINAIIDQSIMPILESGMFR